jgi:hypothetical protein
MTAEIGEAKSTAKIITFSLSCILVILNMSQPTATAIPDGVPQEW